MNGTLIPPSQVLPFPSKKGALLPPSNGPIPSVGRSVRPLLGCCHAPLSLKNNIIVLSINPVCSNVDRIEPMESSISSTESPNKPRLELHPSLPLLLLLLLLLPLLLGQNSSI